MLAEDAIKAAVKDYKAKSAMAKSLRASRSLLTRNRILETE
jgi:hypothetical protein